MLKYRLEGLVFCVVAAVCMASVAGAQSPWDPPVRLGDTGDAWTSDNESLEIVTDEITREAAFQARLVPRRSRSAYFITNEPVQLPAVIEAEFRMPVVVSAFEKGWWRGWGLVRLLQSDDLEKANETAYSVRVSRGRYRDDVSYQVEAGGSGQAARRGFAPLYTAASISPLMNEHERVVLEQRVGDLPRAHDRVYRVRIEAREDSVRTFVNGRFIEEFAGPVQPGKVQIGLLDETRLLGASIRPLDISQDHFIPVSLNDLLNAKGPGEVTALSGQPGRLAKVHGVPFFIPGNESGNDHLDLEPSVYVNRMGNHRNGDSREAVQQPEVMDVTRFTLRVPERIYRRAWVLAASDGRDHSAALMTVRFYRPRMPWSTDAAVDVPLFTATTASESARRVEITTEKGEAQSLWLIPVDIDAARLAAEPMVSVELTKQVYPYRSWPDPAYYNSYPGGLPSAVRLYGLTLEEAPVWFRGTGSQNANLYPDAEQPIWRVLLKNLTDKPQDVSVDINVTDPYGKASSYSKKVRLGAGDEQSEITFEPKREVFGLHTVVTKIKAGDFESSREGAYLSMPKWDRKATPLASAWGLWSWNGGHLTNTSSEDNLRLLRALGAINNFDLEENVRNGDNVDLTDLRKKYGVGPTHLRLVSRSMPAWSEEVPIDPAKAEAYADEKGKEAAAWKAKFPDAQYVNFFAENYLSLRLSHGMSPWAMGEPWFDLDEREQIRLRSHWETAKAAAKGVRKHAPDLKILFGHTPGNFVQPFWMLDDWDVSLFDGFGMDLPQFERMPERQPRATEPSLLFFLKHQMRENNAEDMEVVHLESYFPSTGPMALTQDQQAESVVRTAMLSMALGTTKFKHTWTLHTSGDGWGGSHYGSAGLIDRAPEFNPTPAAAAFATMTGIVDTAKFDGWLETGSRSAFCLRFKDGDRLVYPVWTIRGTRPMSFEFEGTSDATVTDMHGNTKPLAVTDGKAELTVSSTPQWVVVKQGAIKSVSVGEPTYTETPRDYNKVVDSFERKDWKYNAESFARYETNHWDMPRKPGAMKHEFIKSDQRDSTVLRVELAEPDRNAPMVGFYGIYEPARPIQLAGKPKALGFWVNGSSAWNRFIFEVVDAQGESWISAGTRDAWNCDDIHSWSSINHDGWRYMSFPLPGNAPGDSYREADSVWWGSDGDGIVDLPIKVTRVMIEMRPSLVYVNEMLPNENLAIELDDLTVEYESQEDMTNAPVVRQRAAASMMSGQRSVELDNPFKTLAKDGAGDAPEIVKVYPPDQGNNGTRLFVEVSEGKNAAQYKGYVSAHPDGSGAQALAVDKSTARGSWQSQLPNERTLFYNGLVVTRPMYIFVTYVDADGNESKPSPIREIVMRNEFPFE